MSEENLVVVEEKEGYAIMRINRPAKRNAMSKAARIAMLDAMESLKGRFGVIVLTGTDVSFCAGLDLKEVSADREAGIEPDPATSWQAVNVATRVAISVAWTLTIAAPRRISARLALSISWSSCQARR